MQNRPHVHIQGGTASVVRGSASAVQLFGRVAVLETHTL